MDEISIHTAAAPNARTAFRWRLDHRPDVRFGHAAGGVAGILIAAAVVAFVVEVTDDDATLPGVGFNLLIIAAALAVGFRYRGPVRSAAVGALVVAIPQVWLFAIAGDGEGVDRGDWRAILLLTVATYAVLYALTWTRVRAVLLGLALLVAAGWLVFEVADQPTLFGIERGDLIARSGLGGPRVLLSDPDDTLTETGIVEALIAVAGLGTAVVLDRRGKAGAATPFLVVGSLYALGAAVTLGIDIEDWYAGGILAAIAGLAIGLAGSLGRRRATSWFGSAVLLAGTVVIVAQGTEDTVSGGDGAAAVFGAFALLGAALLLMVGLFTSRACAEPLDGGEPFVPRPPRPPTPEPATLAAPTSVEAASTQPPAQPPAQPGPEGDTADEGGEPAQG
jgi:hypothetical protein